MGNNVGKVLGVVAGAALQAVPGVGTVVGAAILAGTVGVGSTVDAIADDASQKEANRKAAEAAKQKADEEIAKKAKDEKDRIEREAAEAKRKADEDAAAAKQAAIEKAERDAAAAKASSERNHKVLEACQKGNLEGVPELLQAMNDKQFDELGLQPLAACKSAEIRRQMQALLTAEEARRKPKTATVIRGSAIHSDASASAAPAV